MAGWLLAAAIALIVTVVVLLPDNSTGVTAETLGGCRHDWRQVDELLQLSDGTTSALQMCTRCPSARTIPLTAPREARRAGEDR